MTISLVTKFRDEARYLKEWIEFHLLVGVDKFYMINHMSQDDPHSVLQPYIDRGIVILEDVMVEYVNYDKPGFYNEVNLVSESIPRYHNIMMNADTDWMMFLNVDEFLYPKYKNTIKEELIDYPNHIGQVSVNWILFGNSGCELKEGELLTEKLTKCTTTDDNLRHVKSIVKKEAYKFIRSVHWCELQKRYKTCDGNGDVGNITQEKYQTHRAVYDRLVINHYVLRDLSYTDKKLKMYIMWGRDIDVEEYSQRYNEDTNTDIQRFVPELKKRML